MGFTVIAQLGSPGKGKSQWKSREALQLTACFRVSSWTNGWRQIRWSHGTVSGPPERGHATKRDDDGKNKAMDPCHAENMGRLLCFSPALLIFKPSPRPPTPNQEALARYWCQRCQRQVVVPPLPPPQRPEGETWTGLDHQQVGGGTSRRSGRAPPPVATRHVHLKLASLQFQVSMTSFSPACAMVLGAGPLLGVEIWIWAKF